MTTLIDQIKQEGNRPLRDDEIDRLIDESPDQPVRMIYCSGIIHCKAMWITTWTIRYCPADSIELE